ncbi:SixA phosphatase family protein [Fulvivirga sedimenti]|uniref:Histidine phosphatase family protein n=1 Tax=Fulvivirga sedimenti TaxID=2879465 RepID=A0A9X1HLQ1_9BACT|nr:histidine phosphatase family protein [Fulvivirga sedimenti]MCA6073285.1 histidine phosphatase family protein [Fulvivirga sedimenti]
MSKSLFLLRHGRAMEKLSGQKDIERELDSIGLQNASRMGMKLQNDKTRFDIIISSPASRALNTASLIAEQLGYDPGRIHINDELYEASVRTLLQVVNNLKDEWESVLLVAHNPAISYLAEYISDAETGTMETCGLVNIDFETAHWEEISQGHGKFISYIYPDLLNF